MVACTRSYRLEKRGARSFSTGWLRSQTKGVVAQVRAAKMP
jgi:hypothetical protein